jgi:hypothetical protein
MDKGQGAAEIGVLMPSLLGRGYRSSNYIFPQLQLSLCSETSDIILNVISQKTKISFFERLKKKQSPWFYPEANNTTERPPRVGKYSANFSG